MNACCVDSWILHQVFPGVVVVGVSSADEWICIYNGQFKACHVCRIEICKKYGERFTITNPQKLAMTLKKPGEFWLVHSVSARASSLNQMPGHDLSLCQSGPPASSSCVGSPSKVGVANSSSEFCHNRFISPQWDRFIEISCFFGCSSGVGKRRTDVYCKFLFVTLFADLCEFVNMYDQVLSNMK